MTWSPRRVRVGDVNLEVVEAGEGPLCLLVHGWPETWWSWRHQIGALAEAGFRVAALNVRGYGGSDAPLPVEAYRLSVIASDLVALIEALGEERAILIGHDWGAPIVWTTSLLHPERVRAVVGMSVPHLGRGAPMPPTQMYASIYRDRFFYMNYFQTPEAPEREFEADIRDALTKIYFMNSGDSTPEVRAQMRARKTGYLDGIEGPRSLPAWLTEADLDHYVADFERGGFRGGIQRYRAMDLDWHELEPLAETKIPQPALFIVGEHDSVLRYAPGMDLLEAMKAFYADLRGQVKIPGAGHWVQQERPEAVNEALRAFLAGLV